MLNEKSSLVTVLKWQARSENPAFVVEWTLLSGNISLFTWITIYEYMNNWENPPKDKTDQQTLKL